MEVAETGVSVNVMLAETVVGRGIAHLSGEPCLETG